MRISGFARSTSRRIATGTLVLSAVLIIAPATLASSADPASRMFSDLALQRALRTADVPLGQLDPRLNWSRLTKLARNTRVVVVLEGQLSPLAGRLTQVDDTGLSIRLSSTGQIERVPRPQVLEVRAATHLRGSRVGAVIGGAAGGVLGFLTAINLAFRDCGGDCGDDKLLIGLSLVGMPVGGALVGYFAFGHSGGLDTIYLRP